MQVQVSPADLEKKNRMISILEERRKTYGSAVLRAILLRDGAEWKNSMTTVVVMHRDEARVEDETYRYPNCILLKRSLSIDEFSEMLERIVTDGKLKIKNLADVTVEGYFSQLQPFDYTPSDDEIFRSGWPADRFVFTPKTKAGYPSEPFAALDAPLFPGPAEAVRVWTEVDGNAYLGTIVFLLPNYSAKIDELRLSSETLTIRLRTLESSPQKVKGKLYLEKLGKKIIQQDVDFETESVTVPVGVLPDWWQVYILAKDTGSILDFRRVHAAWRGLPAGVFIDVRPADIEEILKRGENDQVEFKQDLSKKPEEFLESVVAFANTKGGSILVGVDDSGNVTGLYEQKLEERVQNMIRDNCEPAPNVTVERKEILGKTVYLVRVSEGDEKPYNLRNRGFLIRAGSTDRLMSRIEMDNIYATRQSPPLGRRLY